MHEYSDVANYLYLIELTWCCGSEMLSCVEISCLVLKRTEIGISSWVYYCELMNFGSELVVSGMGKLLGCRCLS